MLNGKDMIIRLIVGLIKKHWMKVSCIKMSQTFLSHLKVLGELLMLIFQLTHVDTLIFALKTSLANLKTDVDKLDLDKLVSVSVS